MHCLLSPEVFSTLVTYSRNKRNEKIILFATIEQQPKIFMLNLHDLSIEVLGRVKN